MQKRNNHILLAVVVTSLLALGGGLYLYFYQGIVTERIINQSLKDKAGVKRVIVYTQESPFKSAIVNKVASFAQENSIYLKVMPVENIEDDLANWDKTIVFSTIQNGEPSDNVRKFISNNKHNSKLGIFLTANSGVWLNKPHDIDAFTGASTIIKNGEYIDEFSERMMIFIAK